MNKLLICILILCGCLVSAQEKDKKQKDENLPKGNSAYEDKNYPDAEADYRISKSKNPDNSASAYNLGNAIYRQKQASESKTAYLKAIETAKTHEQKHKAFHNLGNVYMTEKKYTEAVEAYKNALRNNPDDEETRYNYALAKKFLKDNPPPKKKDDKKKDKKDDKKDQKKDQKKDDKKDGQDKKDQNKDQDKKDQKDQGKPKDEGQPKPKPGGIPKERLQNLLDAVNNEEKKVQQKVNGHKVKGTPVQNEKDW
ncbi:MAG: tetratricopeptide repeat protein [Flavobacterium sp.]|nr:MAG: tetratricopeptide repeat protein [Flavobacterium sp.]